MRDVLRRPFDAHAAGLVLHDDLAGRGLLAQPADAARRTVEKDDVSPRECKTSSERPRVANTLL